MLTTHTSKTLSGCLMLLIVLVLAAPSLAMNDPVTGRWITRDPAGFVDGKNLYEFVGSNPANRADPSGRIIIGLDGLWTPVTSSGRAEIDKIGREIRRRVGDAEYVALTGGAGVGRRALRQHMRRYQARANLYPNDVPACGIPRFIEGFVVIGYSDGATTIHREFRKGHAGRSLGTTQISFVGLVDMVRWRFLGEGSIPNTAPNEPLDRSGTYMLNADLIRVGDVRSSQHGSWKGYVKVSPWGTHWKSQLYESLDHGTIINNLDVQKAIVDRAVQAYRDHSDALRDN